MKSNSEARGLLRRIRAAACRRVLLTPAFLFLFLLPEHSTNAVQEDVPFAPGERLNFQLKWSFIPAGEATLEVHPIKTIDGVPVYHFVMTARTNEFLDNFYKVRDRIDAFADIGMTRSILYKKKQSEGRVKRDVEVNFDWEDNKVHYSTKEKRKDPVTLMPGAFDPLSAFYFARFADLDETSEIHRPVTDGKKCVLGKVRVVDRETVKVPGGTYEAYILEPELKHVGGVFEKTDDARIRVWVTADSRRIPVKIVSKVAVGAFVGELVSASGVR